MTTVQFFGLLNYWVVVFLMMLGFYMVIARQNFIKKIIGINIFQISVILMYITMGKVAGGTAPIVKPEIAARFAQHGKSHSPELPDHPEPGTYSTADSSKGDLRGPFIDDTIYSHPLPSVLMLTAIVVGVGTTALALALVVRIREDYGTIEEDEVLQQDELT
jgi:multicomponent Na+:H+ antiporter subunit C